MAGAVGEATGLSVGSGYIVHCLSQVDTTHAVRIEDWVGHVVPMHLVSSGCALLAYWADDAVDTFLEHELAASVTDLTTIRSWLEAVRADGCIWTAEEFVDGLTSVGAPLFKCTGEVVAAVRGPGSVARIARPPAS